MMLFVHISQFHSEAHVSRPWVGSNPGLSALSLALSTCCLTKAALARLGKTIVGTKDCYGCFPDGECETRRAEATCPKSHSQEMLQPHPAAPGLMSHGVLPPDSSHKAQTWRSKGPCVPKASSPRCSRFPTFPLPTFSNTPKSLYVPSCLSA